ncbi:MAG: metallophosphoesterase [Gemmatimonadota bacterium]|nr:metallophosphoesterase [Gemmatimonadota bacterium]
MIGRVLRLAVAFGATVAAGAGSTRIGEAAMQAGPGEAAMQARAGEAVVQAGAGDPVTFVVLGHLRGDADRSLSHLLDEVLEEVERIDPAFAVLTGDIIWGDPRAELADKTVVEQEWARFDSALSRLSMPIYRVPGNHDVADRATYDLFVARYGEVPRVIDIDGLRLILVNTSWGPELGPAASTGGFQIVEPQLGLIRAALGDPTQYEQAFLFLHHLHFWQEPEDLWWTEVHPMLVDRGVRGVFSGDYGPQKFSHALEDGIDYYQSGIAPNPSLGILKGHEWNRILAQQFDNFLEVTVSGETVDLQVHTVGEVSTGHFTPDLWRDVWGTTRRRDLPRPGGGFERLSAFLETGKAKLFTAGVLGLALLVGFAVGTRVKR